MEVHLDKNDLASARLMLIGVEKGYPKAISRALNKTFTSVKTEMVKLIRSKYNIKATALRKRFIIKRATFSKLFGSVVSKGYGIHLTDITGTRKTLKGVSVDVKKSTGRKLIPHAFIAEGQKSGKSIVFIRKDVMSTASYPIKALYATDPEILYNSAENWPNIQATAQQTLDEKLEHEIDVVLKGFA